MSTYDDKYLSIAKDILENGTMITIEQECLHTNYHIK